MKERSDAMEIAPRSSEQQATAAICTVLKYRLRIFFGFAKASLVGR
jgi:hypothetical protein